MADQPPALLEQVGTAPSGPIWRARQSDGREVLAFQHLLGQEADRQAALDRLRRLARISNRHLAPLRGWWAEPGSVWVVGDLEQGVAVPDLPGGGFLSPQQAAAISFGLLEALDALHSEGLSHGALEPGSVRVLPDGQVVLTGHQLALLRFPSQEELVAEIRQAGRIICQVFGITPERTAGAPRAIEHAAPALVVTARAIAAGTMRSDVRAALSALRETSGPLGGAERLAIGASELGALVSAKRGGAPAGEVRYRNLATPIGSGSFGSNPPPPAPSPPATPPPSTLQPARQPPAPLPAAAPAPVAPRRSWEERRANPEPFEVEEREGPNWLLVAGAIVALGLIVALGGYLGRGLFAGSHPTPPTPAPSASPKAASPVASPSASPTGLPAFAPASAGPVKSVVLKPSSGACSVGASCTLNVVITFTPAGQPHDVTWSFKTYDTCSGAVTDLPGGRITAQGDWNTTDGNTTVAIPAGKGIVDVVALSGPDIAASSPLQVGSGSC